MREILGHQTRYCHEGETYIDDLANVHPANNCYGQIDVNCEKPRP